MMYAHCDQFLKDAARAYVQYLRHNPAPQYRPEFLLVAINEPVANCYGRYISLQQYIAADHYQKLEQIAAKIIDNKSFDYIVNSLNSFHN